MRPARTIFTLSIALVLFICTAGGFVYAASIATIPKTIKHKDLPAFVPDQVVVAFKPGTPSDEKPLLLLM